MMHFDFVIVYFVYTSCE